MKKKKNSIAGRLFYTFGTVFLAAIVTVCLINFSRDARVLQSPAFSTITPKSSSVQAGDGNKDYKTIKYNKSSTSSGTKSRTSSTRRSRHRSTAGSSNPGNNP